MSRIRTRAFLAFCVWLLPVAGFAGEEKTRTIKGWGDVIDPDGDCRISEANDKLTITIPGGHHNFTYAADYTKLNAPRILQGAKGDFVLQTRVRAFPVPEMASSIGISFTSCGLLAWQDSKNFIRWERATVGESLERFVWMERFRDGKSVSFEKKPVGRKDINLRVTRSGNKLTFSFSVDNDANWTDVRTEEVELPQKLQVGVLAINTTTKAFSPELEGLKLTTK